jgi:NAD(P)H dehydrogenase (quinone)
LQPQRKHGESDENDFVKSFVHLAASRWRKRYALAERRYLMAGSKANVLVVFYSRDGSVEALAKAVSEGARDAGADVRLRRVPDIVSSAVMANVPGWEERSKRMLSEYGSPTPADVEWADGVVFGTPTRFGNTSAELKAFIDSLGGLWFQGKLNGKAAGAFTSTAGPHGGNETTVVSLYIPMAHLGFIIVPNGYTHEKILQGHGTPYGSSSTSGLNSAPPTADELLVAKHQGARITEVAAALKTAAR